MKVLENDVNNKYLNNYDIYYKIVYEVVYILMRLLSCSQINFFFLWFNIERAFYYYAKGGQYERAWKNDIKKRQIFWKI
jgi:hypothetical protein